MRDDNYMSYVLIGPDRKQQIEARLLKLRRFRARTQPLGPSPRTQVIRARLLFVGGWLVLLALIVMVVAVLLWPPF